uniref:Small ribosomal subunit protein uS4c n=1 Tax=Dictyopteris divaricata TaxID=156996 RepID=A0A2I4Q350_9PHAE|nr:30S ribosomal protein S4 [Dictyopteris divaricata]YP_010205385.1 30S ribosomal protein S4 [Grateloupia livida]AQZ25096.1 30S ribosomal protein S4 [Dictyopteris divaricata]UAV85954.1 30S ribosomal protein S4 [Grateloupia livida]
MVRYRGPKKKIVNKFGNLAGLTQKTKREQQNQKENDLGEQKKDKASAYKIRLNEKQKLRYYYGVNESQLIRYVKEAKRRKGLTGFVLMQLLEMRLDNIIFRLNLAPTIPAARQLVNHGHVYINKKQVNIPSFQCEPGDSISFNNRPEILDMLKSNLAQKQNIKSTNNSINDHLEFDSNTLLGQVNSLIEEHNLIFTINDMLVIEYYSRLI